MPPSLTPNEKRLLTFAEKGVKSPLDASLLVLQELEKTEEEITVLKDKTDTRFEKLDAKIDDAVSQIKADAPDLNKVLESVRGADGAQGLQGEQGEAGESIVGPEGPAGKDGVDGKDSRDGIDGVDGINGVDGKDADETAILTQIENDLPKLGERIRDGLELLQGEERLDIAAIKGVDAVEARILAVESRRISPGRSLLQLYIGGAKKGAIQYINLIAGSGIALTYANTNGRNDVTISATGSVALTPIAVTGTIDDSNTSFTAASAPNIVIVNGASYRNGYGCTISGTTITLNAPVGTGGDIYAL